MSTHGLCKYCASGKHPSERCPIRDKADRLVAGWEEPDEIFDAILDGTDEAVGFVKGAVAKNKRRARR